MKKARIKKIDLNTCWMYYQPSTTYKTELELYFGNGSTGAPLIYDFEDGAFKLNINPYGDKKGIPLTNIDLAKDHSTLAIEAENKSFLFSARYKTDIVLLKLFEKLHSEKFPADLVSPDDTAIHIGIENGQIIQLSTIEYDKEHSIIPLRGIKIKVQEYNSDGKPDAIDNTLRTLPIVSDNFVYVQGNKHYLIRNLSIQNDILITETTEGAFENTLKGVRLIKDTVDEILKACLPFESKYEKQNIR